MIAPTPSTNDQITSRFDVVRFAAFLLVNLPLVVGPITIFMLISKATLFELIPILTVAVSVILLQYPVLVVLRHWALKTGVFYLSMAGFLFIYGLYNSWDIAAGGYPAGSWNARLTGAVVIMFFGHIFGGIFFPVILLINWLIRRITFVYEAR